MYGITVTVKLQNKLAKDSIVMSLKNMSEELFNESGGLLNRCFTEVSNTQIDMFHLWKDKSSLLKTRTKFSNKFWNDIKEMGGIVGKSKDETLVEMSKLINDANIQLK